MRGAVILSRDATSAICNVRMISKGVADLGLSLDVTFMLDGHFQDWVEGRIAFFNYVESFLWLWITTRRQVKVLPCQTWTDWSTFRWWKPWLSASLDHTQWNMADLYAPPERWQSWRQRAYRNSARDWGYGGCWRVSFRQEWAQ